MTAADRGFPVRIIQQDGRVAANVRDRRAAERWFQLHTGARSLDYAVEHLGYTIEEG